MGLCSHVSPACTRQVSIRVPDHNNIPLLVGAESAVEAVADPAKAPVNDGAIRAMTHITTLTSLDLSRFV